MAGLWEFPGGGVEPSERAEEALVRELDEELGIGIEIGHPLTFAWHRDAQREILLLFYRATLVAGSPQGREGQEVGWFLPGELSSLQMPPADAELVRLLGGTPTRPVSS
jgi:8-oxo-dGTP diphosphatase